MVAPHLDVVDIPLDEIDQHPLNPHNGDIDALEESIVVNGFYAPIIVQASTGYILAGNHRYQVAVKRGWSTIPGIVLDVDDDRARRIMVADNQITRLGFEDQGILLDLLEGLNEATDALLGTGFSPRDLQRLLDAADQPLDFPDEDRKEASEKEDEAETKPPRRRLLFSMLPKVDSDGRVYELTLSKTGFEHITPRDFNTLRKALGQEPLSADEMATYDVPDWRRRS
jgi:ParB-like chromosome segregation protein Spo0J